MPRLHALAVRHDDHLDFDGLYIVTQLERVVAAQQERITYTVTPLTRDGSLRISTAYADVVAALGQFIASQRIDHRAP